MHNKAKDYQYHRDVNAVNRLILLSREHRSYTNKFYNTFDDLEKEIIVDKMMKCEKMIEAIKQYLIYK